MRNKLPVLFALLLLVGCATPAVTTPKPDIRPVQVSHEKAQASVGKSREDIRQLRQSQARAGQALKEATASLDKFTGVSTAVDDAKHQLFIVQSEFSKAVDYAAWAEGELDNAWTYESQVGTTLGTLGLQIDTAHKNEKALADWKKANEPVITQINSWWGLGAFGYGAKILARHLLVLGIILVVIGGLLWFFVPTAIPFIRMIGSFLGGIFRRIGDLFRKK